MAHQTTSVQALMHLLKGLNFLFAIFYKIHKFIIHKNRVYILSFHRITQFDH
jgi:hypothetical protein